MDFSSVVEKLSYLFLWMAVLAEDGLGGGALAILVYWSDVLLLLICGFQLGMADALLPPVLLILLCLS